MTAGENSPSALGPEVDGLLATEVPTTLGGCFADGTHRKASGTIGTLAVSPFVKASG